MAYVSQDLLDRIRSLEREVRQLRGRAEMRPAMNRVLNGEVAIGEGGTLNVYPPGHVPGQDSSVFSVGRWLSDENVDTYGTALRREDGSAALTVGGNGVGNHQMVRMRAADGQIIVTDDAFAPGYLGRPYIPIPMAAGKDFGHTSWGSTHLGHIWTQHAVLTAYWSLFTPSGTAAQSRLMISTDSGLRQLGDTLSSSGGETYTTQRFTRADLNLVHSEVRTMYLQARVTSGSGVCTSWCRGLWGDNTSGPDEA